MGTIPQALCGISSLVQLDLHGNQFDVRLPEWCLKLSSTHSSVA